MLMTVAGIALAYVVGRHRAVASGEPEAEPAQLEQELIPSVPPGTQTVVVRPPTPTQFYVCQRSNVVRIMRCRAVQRTRQIETRRLCTYCERDAPEAGHEEI